MTKKSHPKALSLIFAIVLMTITLVIGSSMVNRSIRAKLRSIDIFRSTQAYYAGRSGLEKAFAEAKENGIGHEKIVAIESELSDTNDDGIDDVATDYQIFSRAKRLDWWNPSEPDDCDSNGNECYIPIPGTGTAGQGCDFEDGETQNWDTDAYDECNWNKIHEGETIVVPLFYEDKQGTECLDGFCDPSDTLLNMLKVRIRTPLDPDGDTSAPRYQLDDSPDDVVVHWELSGRCDSDGDPTDLESCYLIPTEGKAAKPPFDPGYPESLIQESEINEASNNNEVLNGVDYGINQDGDPTIILEEFLLDSSMIESYLKLVVINELLDLNSNPIPYLEYQIIVDQTISDNKFVYTSNGKTDGRLGRYIQHLKATQNIGNAPIINFVFQN